MIKFVDRVYAKKYAWIIYSDTVYSDNNKNDIDSS